MRLRTLAIACLLTAVAAVAAPAAPASAKLSGPFSIQNVNSGLCLAARAGSGERPVVQTTCDFTVGQYWADQHWELRYVDYARQIYNRALGLCLVARGSGESTVVATSCGSWPDQLWYWMAASDGADQFENVNSGLCLTTRGSGESRAVVTTCDWNADSYWPDQHWSTF